jgi:hypothetical protein
MVNKIMDNKLLMIIMLGTTITTTITTIIIPIMVKKVMTIEI